MTFHPDGLLVLGDWGQVLVTLGAESLITPPEFVWIWSGLVFWW